MLGHARETLAPNCGNKPSAHGTHRTHAWTKREVPRVRVTRVTCHGFRECWLVPNFRTGRRRPSSVLSGKNEPLCARTKGPLAPRPKSQATDRRKFCVVFEESGQT
jgi:hypothetical protein